MSIFGNLFGRKHQPRKAIEVARPIRARYDAAQDSNETANIWSAADALDADSANSLAVRTKLRKRSRYERGNNGHCAGIIRTQANYVVGTGPTLQMLTGSPGFNAMVESAWLDWCKAVGLFRKLRNANRAKTGDGEAFMLAVSNPMVSGEVKLDLVNVECDRVTSPVGKMDKENYIDGITFDAFGNPESYDILRRHPGASWWSALNKEYDTYAAKFVCHWFGGDDRPGQHRGVPELTPTLNLFATGRRYREAVVAAAETAADLCALIESNLPADDSEDAVTPLTTLPIEKRTMTFLPDQQKATQMKAEQPTTTHAEFTRTTLCEEARPLNMPYNIAACDSSGYSYSGGQLDHQTYFVSIDVERQDCESMVLDKIFALWFAMAQDANKWNVDPFPAPKHGWAWPGRPHSDPTKIAEARKVRLSCGDAAPSEFAAEDGVDYEDRIAALAKDYGVTDKEIRKKLFDANFQQSGGAPNQQQKPQDNGDSKQQPPAKANGAFVNRFAESLS